MYSLRNSYHGVAGNAYSLSSLKTWNSSVVKSIENERLATPNFYRNAIQDVDNLIKDA